MSRIPLGTLNATRLPVAAAKPKTAAAPVVKVAPEKHKLETEEAVRSVRAKPAPAKAAPVSKPAAPAKPAAKAPFDDRCAEAWLMTDGVAVLKRVV